MSAENKQIHSNAPGSSSKDKFICVNDVQANDETGKKKHDRKLLLFILLMLLVAAQVIALLANSGFIDRSSDPLTVTEQPVSLSQLKKVEIDLKKVVKDLEEINSSPDLKDDHVDVEKVVVKPAPVPVAPVVVKQVKKDIKPKQKITKDNSVALVVKAPVIIVAVQKSEEEAVEEIVVAEIKPPYIKHDSKGNFLEDETEQWTCVHDTQSGLMWEVKAQGDAMRDADNLYSWFNPENASVKGKSDGGRCKGDAACDTHAYVQAMNEKQYCGHSDWRLPTREQMQTLVYLDNGDEKVKINKQYFPQTMPSWYWTASENSNSDELAWYVLFRNGLALKDLKERPKHIRLVREVMTN